MKIIISKNKAETISEFEKKIIAECSKGRNLAVDPAALISALDMQNNWSLVCGWFYLLGFQRYQGNHAAQTYVSQVKRGIARFIKNLAAYTINKIMRKPLFADETCSVWIEKKVYDEIMTTQSAVFKTDLSAWNAIMNKVGYTAFHDKRSNGDDKIVWMPTVYLSTPRKISIARATTSAVKTSTRKH